VKHFILGTAGHVDHGKSTLIKALTDVETDRLPEEKERGLSIDLGFAPLTLDGEGEKIQLGVVDVPGHHRFLRNMIAGVGGFDVCLLVVDCLEGVKPQTQEHLKILELLKTRAGVVALSKVDKTDEDSVEIARWELEELLSGTFLQGAAIVPTSAVEGTGLDELRTELYQVFSKLEERNRQGVARLPVDRAFSKVGFGDVVTGSLWSGTMKVGGEVEILPGGETGKIRGLQVHGESVDSVTPGQRVAVNISGLDKIDLKRGHTVVSPVGALPVGQRFGVSLTLFVPEPKLLKRKSKATFFQGTFHQKIVSNLVGHKDTDTEVFGQLYFEDPVLLCRGDRFLLRDETDRRILGGGTILALDQHPFRRSRSADFLTRYEALTGGGEMGRILQTIRQMGGQAREKALKKHQGLSQQEWEEQLALLQGSDTVLLVGKDTWWDAELFEELSTKIVQLLGRLVEAAPWKAGWRPEEIATLLELRSGTEDVLGQLVSQEVLQRNGPLFSPHGHQPALPESEDARAREVVESLERDRFSPQDWTEYLDSSTGADKKLRIRLEEYLLGTGGVIRLTDKVYTTRSVLEEAREVLGSLAPEGFTASEARQILDTSRKYIIPFLEWMDQAGWTVRSGDVRKLSSPKGRG